jgi:hypothetical protein
MFLSPITTRSAYVRQQLRYRAILAEGFDH